MALLTRVRSGTLQIVTIIFSVSVALQFQDCHERNTNARIGRHAQNQIEQEIAFNRKAVADSSGQLNDIVDTMRARRVDAKTLDLQFDRSLSLPALYSGAYDAAVASGALRHLSPERAAAIARLYKLQNWVTIIQQRLLMLDLDPVLALASDTQENRYSIFLLSLTAYERTANHFDALLQFYDAIIADKPLPEHRAN